MEKTFQEVCYGISRRIKAVARVERLLSLCPTVVDVYFNPRVGLIQEEVKTENVLRSKLLLTSLAFRYVPNTERVEKYCVINAKALPVKIVIP